MNKLKNKWISDFAKADDVKKAEMIWDLHNIPHITKGPFPNKTEAVKSALDEGWVLINGIRTWVKGTCVDGAPESTKIKGMKIENCDVDFKDGDYTMNDIKISGCETDIVSKAPVSTGTMDEYLDDGKHLDKPVTYWKDLEDEIRVVWQEG